MLNSEILEIIETSNAQGWVMEPEAKKIFSLAGIEVPCFKWAKGLEEALSFANHIGYPVVAKIVSPAIIHKSEKGGVIPNIKDGSHLHEVFSRFSLIDKFAGILIEERLEGVELIIGGKMDYQFGPIVLMGIGGTAAEIYRDTSLRMAPLKRRDVVSMVEGLKSHQLLQGFRGSRPINLEKLSSMMIAFSTLLMELKDHVESIDLNPVMCTEDNCIVADARIMLPLTQI